MSVMGCDATQRYATPRERPTGFRGVGRTAVAVRAGLCGQVAGEPGGKSACHGWVRMLVGDMNAWEHRDDVPF